MRDAVASINAGSAVGSAAGHVSGSAFGTNDTITFSLSNPSTIQLTVGSLTLTKSVTVQGPGSTALTINGNGTFTDFVVNSGVTATFSDLAITGGSSTNGGGINNKGTLTLSNVIVSGNTATKAGGGIENSGTLSLNTVTVAANTAGTNGGGIDNSGTLNVNKNSIIGGTATLAGNTAVSGGGVYNTATLAIDTSTIGGTSTSPGNTATTNGGGVWTSGQLSGTAASVSYNQTNSAANGNGAGILVSGATATVSLTSSFVDHNSSLAGGSGSGGAILINNANGQVTLTNTDVSYNSAANSGGGISNTGTLTLSGATITNNSAGKSGGGIDSSGTLNATNGTISNNTAGTTGGGISSSGSATLTSTTVSSNTSTAQGGGIHNGGSLTLASNSTVKGNTSSANGGGIFDFASSTLAVSNSVVTLNTGALGGGIFNQANGSGPTLTATITNSSITNNTATASGGGLYNQVGWNTQVTGTDVSYNKASGGNGGGLYNTTGSLNVSSSSITYNTATPTALNGGGGGIWNDSTLVLTNDTVAFNQLAGTKTSFGAGVELTGGTVTLTNVTIAYNRANSTSGVSSSGALANTSSTNSVTLVNTLVAGNLAANAPTTPDVSGQFTTVSNSLIGVTAGGTIGSGTGNLLNIAAPLLGTLQNYGGSTVTIPLLPGSPAIDAGTSSGAPTTDQRGYARVGAVDIGAFESRGFTLTVSGGTNQSTLINTNFFTALSVTVTANGAGEPVANGVITFTSPASGPSTSPTLVTATVSSGGTAATTVQANGTPGGPYTVTASAVGSTSASFSLTNLLPLTFSPSTLVAATVGVAYSQSFTASGGTAPYVNYRVSAGGLPAGLSLSTAGLLSGTPTAGGSFSFTISVTDSSSGYGPYTGSQNYSLTVNPPIIVLSPPTLPAATVGIPYSQAITASGGTLPFVNYQITTGALPAGLTLSTAGLLSGTPTAGGSFSFTISVTDSSTGTGPYTLQQNYSLTINPPTLTLNPSTLLAATVGFAYSQIFIASGGTPTFKYQITSGALPAGLSLSAAGLLSGTPTAGGSFNFTIRVSDSSTGTGPYTLQQNYSLLVNPPTLTLTPLTLTGATLGLAYSQVFSVSGGTPTYNYQVSAGTLPAGLTLSAAGVLSGTPTALGRVGFTVTASDSSSGAGPYTVSRSYSLNVTRLLTPPVIVTGQDSGGQSLANSYSGPGQLSFVESALANAPNGARVAVGDLLGNGVNDLIVGAGPGAGSQVTVYDGRNGQVLYSFYAFPGTVTSSATVSAGKLTQVFSFTGGVYVAAGDPFGKGYDDIIVGAGPGGGPQVEIFDGRTGALVSSFFAFSSSFRGGVRVAAGDLFGNGTEQIIAAAGPGGGPQIAVWDGLGQTLFSSFYAFSPNFTGGVYVAAGDVYGIGTADIIAGAGAGGGPQVSIFDGASRNLLASFYAFSPNFTGGVRVGVTDAHRKADILVGAGPGGGPQVETFDATTLTLLGSFFAYHPSFTGGVFVG